MTRRLMLLTAACSLLAVSAFGANLTRGPETRNNDDSCDIGLAPAATLLLPHFAVDFDNILGENTVFTITNTGPRAQVARVTLWTDFAYPVLTFDVYLTGYDAQSISLYDVFARGIIGGETGVDVSPLGERSRKNPLLDRSNCGTVPNRLDAAMLLQLKSAFTEGVVPGCATAGFQHEHALGYATIDVVGNCAPGRGPTDPLYFSRDIRYENVLTGDYAFVNGGQQFAQASPMVHIRAVPGGGTPSTRLPGPVPRLEKTFYGRFQDPADPHLDARQPLPSTFAVRWINGGTGAFNTSLMIWRDGYTGPAASCADYADNGKVIVAESVSFDEDENGLGISQGEIIIPVVIGREPITLPATSFIQAGDDDVFPQETFDEHVAGWLYLNLDDDDCEDGSGAHQNWVVVNMRAQGTYSVAFDAAWLGNGCSPAVVVSDFTDDGAEDIMPGPAEDVNP
jgi:hypothetical protein